MSDVEIVVSDKYVSRGGFGTAKKEVKELGKDVKDADRDSKSLGKSLGSLGPSAKSGGLQIGSALSSGVSSALGSVKNEIPKLLTNPGTAGAAAGAGLLLGGAMSGALVTGFGAGLAGLGLVTASKTPAVKNEITKLKQDIGAEMSTISQPFEKTWKDITSSARRGFAEIKPELSAMFSDVAPEVSRFGDSLVTALAKFGPSIQPIGRAFKAVLSDLDGRLPGVVEGLADSFADLARSVEKNPKALGDAIFLMGKFGEVALGTMGVLNDLYEVAKENLLPDWATRAIDAWSMYDEKINAVKESQDGVTASGNRVTPAMRSMAEALSEVADESADAETRAHGLRTAMDQLTGQTPSYTEGLANASDAVRGMKDMFETAEDRAKGFGSALLDQSGAFDVTNENGAELYKGVRDVTEAFDDMAAAVANGQGSREQFVADANRQRESLNAVWRAAGLNEQQINSLNRAYGLTPQQIQTRLDLLGVSTAQGMIDGFIRMNNGRTIQIYTSVLGSGGLASAGRLATGGISSTAHAATGGARGGDTIINEQGPENVRLPNGSTVINAGTTRRLEKQMFGEGGMGGGRPITVVLELDGKQIAAVLVDPLKGVVRKRGGSPEVLG